MRGMSVFVVAWCLAGFARAQEAINAGLELRREGEVRITSMAITLAPDRIEQTIKVRNGAREPRTLEVWLAAPPEPFAAGTAAPDLRELELKVDGKPLQPTRRRRVLLGGREIGWRVALTGWSEEDLITFMRSGRAPAGKPALPVGWLDAQGHPRFTLQRDYLFHPRVDAGGTAEYTVRYTPQLEHAQADHAAGLKAALGAEGCIDTGVETRLRALNGSGGLDVQTLAFRPTGMRKWPYVIAGYSLTLRKGDEAQAMWGCMDGGKRVDARTFQYTRSAFVPPALQVVRWAQPAR